MTCDGRIAERARPEFGHVGRHRRRRIELALGDEDAGEHASERLGHGHGDVLLVRLERAEVALERDATAMQDGDAICIGLGKRCIEGERPAVHRRELHAAEILLGTGQDRGRARPAPYTDGGHELADVAPGTAQLRELAERAIGECDCLVGRRWEPGHPSK
jgi:hypothetical protein